MKVIRINKIFFPPRPSKNTAETVQKISLRELNTYITDSCGPILLETIKSNCRCNNFFNIRKGNYSVDQTGHELVEPEYKKLLE